MSPSFLHVFFFFFNDTATTEIYTLSLHDALPISRPRSRAGCRGCASVAPRRGRGRASRPGCHAAPTRRPPKPRPQAPERLPPQALELVAREVSLWRAGVAGDDPGVM